MLLNDNKTIVDGCYYQRHEHGSEQLVFVTRHNNVQYNEHTVDADVIATEKCCSLLIADPEITILDSLNGWLEDVKTDPEFIHVIRDGWDNIIKACLSVAYNVMAGVNHGITDDTRDYSDNFPESERDLLTQWERFGEDSSQTNSFRDECYENYNALMNQMFKKGHCRVYRMPYFDPSPLTE